MSLHPILAIRAVSPRDQDEAGRIDAFVRAHPDATPFHLSGWSRAIERACGQKAVTLIAEDGDGRIAGVLPMTEVRSALFGKALVSSGFAVDGGVLAQVAAVAASLEQDALNLNQPAHGEERLAPGGSLSKARLEPRSFETRLRQAQPLLRMSGSDYLHDTLVDAALAHARAGGFPTVELRGGEASGEGWHIDTETYLGFARDLAADDEAELLAIPRKQRAEVRKSLGFELTVETGSGARDREAHFAVYAESVRNLGTPVFPPALFAAMLEELGDEADILTVRQNGRPIASVLSLYWRGTVMPYWGGGVADARTWRANDLMYYALMLHARKEKGCTRFDFGRSKAGTGPAAFKRNWGFEGQPLSYAKMALDGGAPRDINPLSAKYRFQVAAWQKLPLWLANRIGPLISRGLG